MSRSDEDNKKKKKKDQSVWEKEIFAFMQAMARQAVEAAINDLLKDFH